MVPSSAFGRHALLLGHGDVHREEDGGGRVDGHARRDLVERNSVENSVFHVREGVDRDADLADLARGQRVVGVVADLGGQIEGDGEAGLPLLERRYL